MYYRRKILLALLEAFGGSLERTDCQKLLFLFCRYAKKDFYDFFPYKYGGFSLLAYYDKRRLTDLGYLRHSEEFQLSEDQNNYIDQLKNKDQTLLKSFSSKLENLRGRELIRYVYLSFPHYVIRSTIVNDILTDEEFEQVSFWHPPDKFSRLFTIGYEGITIDAYLDKLISNNIYALVDVRNNPNSMKYGFSKKKLQQYLGNVGIEYFHLRELGIASKLRKNLDGPESYQKLFNYYETEILPDQTISLEKLKTILAKYKRIALTCFEADHLFCHRHKITDYLENSLEFDTPVVHLK